MPAGATTRAAPTEILQAGGNVSRPNLLISEGLLASLAERTDQGLLNLKDLMAKLSTMPRRFFGGPVGRRNVVATDLLIPQGLLASLGERKDQRLLNLKDLLAVLPPCRRRRSRKRAGLAELCFVQNRAKFRHFRAKTCR